jgi:hypothetical protein
VILFNCFFVFSLYHEKARRIYPPIPGTDTFRQEAAMHDDIHPAIGAHRCYGVERRSTGPALRIQDAIAEEAPVALVYNGISHAVMLASPPTWKTSASASA